MNHHPNPSPIFGAAEDIKSVKITNDEVRPLFNDARLEDRCALDLSQERDDELIDTNNYISVPLKQWIQTEAEVVIVQSDPTQHDIRKASLLRMVTVAYAIGELMRHAARSSLEYSSLELLSSMDNFSVRLSTVSDLGWEVAGMVTFLPPLLLSINADSFSSNIFFQDAVHRELSGRELFATLMGHSESKDGKSSIVDDCDLCYYYGVLLHAVFCGMGSTSVAIARLSEGCGSANLYNGVAGEPVTKKSSLSRNLVSGAEFASATSFSESSRISEENSGKVSVQVNFFPLSELGYPPSLSQLVKNLVDCGHSLFRPNDSYPSLELAISDLKLLLLYPERFLFDNCEAWRKMKAQRAILYGRSAETGRIADSFCRVTLTGESEAFLIEGFSGCGKTSLVESVFESVRAAGGCVVTEKFDEVSSRGPLSVVLSAFNEFCISITENSDSNTLIDLSQRIVEEFGTHIHFLIRAVPGVQQFLSAGNFEMSVTDVIDAPVNFHSLCFTIRRFMQIVSCPSRPLLLFLDDIHWADLISLGLVQCVLSDVKGRSCVFFVGTYRDNELKTGNNIVSAFVDMLSQFNVPSTSIRLDGLGEDDVSSLVSQVLGILPRQCRSLAEILCRKTNGNPFFVLELLRSLIDRGLVKFNLRERLWSWDNIKIGAEDITDNVLHLLGRKLTSLSSSEQLALKVASCFGTKIKSSAVLHLSGSEKFFAFKSAFGKLVEDGYMDFDGSHYRFVHDKIREAAYDLISPDVKDQFHFNVGMEMLGEHEDDSEYQLATIEQINYGAPSLLHNEIDQINVAKLNYEAGLKSMQSSNYFSAHVNMKAAVLLLPDDLWTAHYDLSLKCFLNLAKSAFPCGCTDEAKAAIDQIIKNAKRLDDKLDAYLLLVSVQYFGLEADQAVSSCIHVIGLLGEHIPQGDLHKSQMVPTILKTKEMFAQKSADDLRHMLDMAQNEEERSVSIMKFYSRLVMVALIVKPKLSAFYTALWANFAVTSKVHIKYAAAAFVGFGSCLYTELTDDVMLGYRMGKIGLMSLNRYKPTVEDLSIPHCLYYLNLGFLFEPFQASLDMHRNGYMSATQYGDSSLAGLHFCLAIEKKVLAGEKLSSIKTEIEDYITVSKQFVRLDGFVQIFYNTVLEHIGKEVIADKNLSQSHVHELVQCNLDIMCSLYNGHLERVQFLVKKMEQLCAQNDFILPQHIIHIAFYSGLAMTGLYRSKKMQKTALLKDIPIRFLPILSKAEECSSWNFKCKASLLKAEYLSLKSKAQKNDEAEYEYDEAISAARSSKFVHEEGLACERAGMYYKQCGHYKKALDLLYQAKTCFEDWGAQKRVDHTSNEIALLLKLSQSCKIVLTSQSGGTT